MDISKLKKGDRVRVSYEGEVASVDKDDFCIRHHPSGRVNYFFKEFQADVIAEVLPEPIKVGTQFQSKFNGNVFTIVGIEGKRTAYTYKDRLSVYSAGCCGINEWGSGFERLN